MAAAKGAVTVYQTSKNNSAWRMLGVLNRPEGLEIAAFAEIAGNVTRW
ncbi:hypothetical protein ACFIQF_00960 [Comamonas sp. J-3]